MSKYQPFLRNEVEDTPENRRQLENLLTDFLVAEPDAKGLGQIGTAYRLVGNFEQAAIYFEQAVRLARLIGNATTEVTNLIRLATMGHYTDRHAEALPLFYLALETCQTKNIGQLEDFACQHLAKCLVEMGRVAESLPFFERALHLRIAKNDPELIASTEQALAAARQLLSDCEAAR